MFVKICGITTPDGARAVVDAGADAIGFVMSARSRRTVSTETAAALRALVGDAARTVLVTDDLPVDEAARIAVEIGADVVQLHGGAYDAASVAQVRALGVPEAWRATAWDAGAIEPGAHGEDVLLVDSPVPGSGESWALDGPPPAWSEGRVMVAGGLTPENVAAVIERMRPWGVDVSSGVESAPAVKDAERIARFVEHARAAAR